MCRLAEHAAHRGRDIGTTQRDDPFDRRQQVARQTIARHERGRSEHQRFDRLLLGAKASRDQHDWQRRKPLADRLEPLSVELHRVNACDQQLERAGVQTIQRLPRIGNAFRRPTLVLQDEIVGRPRAIGLFQHEHGRHRSLRPQESRTGQTATQQLMVSGRTETSGTTWRTHAGPRNPHVTDGRTRTDRWISNSRCADTATSPPRQPSTYTSRFASSGLRFLTSDLRPGDTECTCCESSKSSR